MGVEHFDKKADYVQRVEFIVVRVNADGEKERCEFLENDFVSQILEDGREVLIPAANLTGDRFCESFSIALARIPLLQAHFRLLVEYQNSVDHSRIETKVLKLISRNRQFELTNYSRMESESIIRKLVRRAREAMVLLENLQLDIENRDNSVKLDMLESVSQTQINLKFTLFSYSRIIFNAKSN